MAHAIDLDAGDYVAVPAGTTLAMLYALHAQRDKLYAQGQRQQLQPGLSSTLGMARLAHYMNVGGFTVAPQILVPYGRLAGKDDTAALGQASGVGDVLLAAPVWVVNDPASQTYWGVTPVLYLPTGSYDRERALNLGENRWKLNLQTGIAKAISGPWHMDLTADVMFHGSNHDYGSASATLKQKPLFQTQGYLRYKFAPGANAYVGLSRVWGGKTQVDGVGGDNETQQLKASVGASYWIGPRTQILGAIGRDIQVRNGFKEDLRIVARVQRFW